MKLRSRITIGTLGFLLISLTLCCTLMIYVSKKNMLNSTTSYTKTELEKLQAENLRLRAENALLKKVKALVEEQEARARLNGQKPSTN